MDRQNNLRNLQLYDDTLNVRGAERKVTLETLDKVVSLRISPENSVSLRYTQHILRKKPLEELHLGLRARSWKSSTVSCWCFISLLSRANQPRTVETSIEQRLPLLAIFSVNLWGGGAATTLFSIMMSRVPKDRTTIIFGSISRTGAQR